MNKGFFRWYLGGLICLPWTLSYKAIKALMAWSTFAEYAVGAFMVILSIPLGICVTPWIFLLTPAGITLTAHGLYREYNELG